MQHRKYFITLLLAALVCACAIAAFNLAVDPLGADGLVSRKYKPIFDVQKQKYDQIFRDGGYKRYDRYILGSSRVLNLHLADKPFLADMYNFGIPSGFNQQKYFIIKELCKVRPPETILLQIRFENFFEDPWTDEEEFAKTFTDNSSVGWKALFGSQLVDLSWKTLDNALHGKYIVYINEDGSLTYADKEARIRKGKFDFSERALLASALGWKPVGKPYSAESFRKIKAAADECGVRIIPFIVPEHESLFAYLMHTRRDEYIRARHELLDIFGWYYDFCGLNEITTRAEHFYDSVHYRPYIGDKILGRLLDREDMAHPGFGVKITRDNIHNHVRKLHAHAAMTPYTKAVAEALKKEQN